MFKLHCNISFKEQVNFTYILQSSVYTICLGNNVAKIINKFYDVVQKGFNIK